MRTIISISENSGYQFVRRVIPILFCAIVLAACSVGGASSDRLLKKLIQEKQPGFVYDEAQLISPADRDRISRLFNNLEARTTAQLKVVTLPSLEGGEIRDFANRLYEGWGIGQKGKDNGALMLMSQEDRQIWIEVGYGLEGALPDAKVGRLLDQNVMPSFRQDDFSGGLVKGAEALAAVVAQEYGVQLEGTPSPAATRGPAREEDGHFGIMQLLFLIAMIYLAIRHPYLFLLLLSMGGGGRSSGGFGGGGFRGGGFGGGQSGGGGAGRSW